MSNPSNIKEFVGNKVVSYLDELEQEIQMYKKIVEAHNIKYRLCKTIGCNKFETWLLHKLKKHSGLCSRCGVYYCIFHRLDNVITYKLKIHTKYDTITYRHIYLCNKCGPSLYEFAAKLGKKVTIINNVDFS